MKYLMGIIFCVVFSSANCQCPTDSGYIDSLDRRQGACQKILFSEPKLYVMYYGNCVNDKREGLFYFVVNGRTIFTEYFVNDLREGVKIAYYKNGRIRAVLNFKTDMLNGPVFLFKKNGEYEAMMLYKDNEIVCELIKPKSSDCYEEIKRYAERERF